MMGKHSEQGLKIKQLEETSSQVSLTEKIFNYKRVK